METTFQEARRHLGVETQRQWSELAIRRTTPALLGLFSLVTLFAHQRMVRSIGAVRHAAWYHKPHPTFSDALALVRKELWAHATFRRSLWDLRFKHESFAMGFISLAKPPLSLSSWALGSLLDGRVTLGSTGKAPFGPSR